MPPDAARAFSTSSDLLRGEACQEWGLAWVMAMGRLEWAIVSSVERSAECDMSITRPNLFISRTTSRPIRVKPESSLS